MQTQKYKGPLTGLTVIDFGHYYAGPVAAMLLVEQGATVVRVTRPGQPELPSQQYRVVNRNKKLIELDLKTEEGKARALKLISKADVVIENFRPGVMKRLGLDYHSVQSFNPGLVYLSLPGFASADKERASIQAWEGVICAASCVYTDTSPVRKLIHHPPVYTWAPQSSMYGAIHGCTAVMAALLARRNHGWGTNIEVPLVDASMSAFGYDFWADPGYPPSSKTVGEEGVKRDHFIPDTYKPLVYSDKDTKELSLEKVNKGMRIMFKKALFTCADGREVLLWAERSEKYMKALGIERQLRLEGFTFAGRWEKPGLDNNVNGVMSPEREARLIDILRELFLTKTAEEWETLLAEKVAIGMMRTREEWLALDPLMKSGILSVMDDGSDVLTVSGRMADISGPEEIDLSYTEPEQLSWNDIECLLPVESVSHKPDGPKPAQSKCHLLQGLKILDMANIIAGPDGPFILQQFGAEVIKLDVPDMLLRSGAQMLAYEVGQGKRSLLMDLKAQPGREVFEKLVSWADVVTHNNLDDVARRLGVAHDQLGKINADVVSAQFSACGGTHRGGWEQRNGWDLLLQATSGLMVGFGSLKEPHLHGLISAADYLGGALFAYTILVGVWQQRTIGYAGEARTSLARAVNAVQLPYMIAKDGKSEWGEDHGQDAVGDHPWQRLYECADDWIYVGTSEARAGVLAQAVIGQPDIDEKAMEQAFKTESCAVWLARLTEADIACHKVMSVLDICRDGHLRRVDNDEAIEVIGHSNEVLHWDKHPCEHDLILKAPTYIRVGDKPTYKRFTPTPIFGQNSKEILRDMGLSNKDIEGLINLGVVHEFQPGMGGKDVYVWKAGK